MQQINNSELEHYFALSCLKSHFSLLCWVLCNISYIFCKVFCQTGWGSRTHIATLKEFEIWYNLKKAHDSSVIPLFCWSKETMNYGIFFNMMQTAPYLGCNFQIFSDSIKTPLKYYQHDSLKQNRWGWQRLESGEWFLGGPMSWSA